jgi:hypothetical protein
MGACTRPVLGGASSTCEASRHMSRNRGWVGNHPWTLAAPCCCTTSSGLEKGWKSESIEFGIRAAFESVLGSCRLPAAAADCQATSHATSCGAAATMMMQNRRYQDSWSKTQRRAQLPHKSLRPPHIVGPGRVPAVRGSHWRHRFPIQVLQDRKAAWRGYLAGTTNSARASTSQCFHAQLRRHSQRCFPTEEHRVCVLNKQK